MALKFHALSRRPRLLLIVLARAVRWQLEHRVLVNGHPCVVFR